jgi:hypothetical protein
MTFSKYDIDPAHNEAMRSAFRMVCSVLQLDCAREDAITDLIAMKIVELANAGELDSDGLYSRVLLDLPVWPESVDPR